jgi:Luciferase-like monooxygenase
MADARGDTVSERLRFGILMAPFHPAGDKIIASPEIFIGVAAERTRHIRLGTGVVSVSYHNPLWVAERAVLLDHLTRTWQSPPLRRSTGLRRSRAASAATCSWLTNGPTQPPPIAAVS